MKPEKVTPYIYVSYEEECVEVYEDTQGCDGPYSGYRHDAYDYKLLNAYADKPPIRFGPYWDSVELVGAEQVPDTVYVLYVRYGTGHTFGRSDGRGHIVKAYASLAEAEKNRKLIENDEWDSYAPWKGYFESYQGADIETMSVIRETTSDNKKM